MRFFEKASGFRTWTFKEETATLKTNSLDYANTVNNKLCTHNLNENNKNKQFEIKGPSFKIGKHYYCYVLKVSGCMTKLENYVRNDPIIKVGATIVLKTEHQSNTDNANRPLLKKK